MIFLWDLRYFLRIVDIAEGFKGTLLIIVDMDFYGFLWIFMDFNRF